MVIAILTAPKTGKATRNWLSQQYQHLAHLLRRTARRSSTRARYLAGIARGSVTSLRQTFQPKEEEYIDDDLISDRVRTQLGENPLTWDLPRLNINTENGIVTIRGPVQSERQRHDVENVVRRVKDVVGVVNDLRVVA